MQLINLRVIQLTDRQTDKRRDWWIRRCVTACV